MLILILLPVRLSPCKDNTSLAICQKKVSFFQKFLKVVKVWVFGLWLAIKNR